MWSREHVMPVSADPEAVWRRWTDARLWPEDDHDVRDAQLDPVLGAVGWVRPRSMPRFPLEVVRAERPLRLALRTRLPGAQMTFTREQTVERGRTVRLVHGLRFTGPLARFWRSLLGNSIVDGCPAVMARLAARAQLPTTPDPTSGPRVGAPRPAPANRKGPAMPVSVNMDSLLDKAYENSTLAEILKAPVDALAGVSASDAEALKSAFNIKTVEDLGKNKYFGAAVTLYELSQAGAK